MSKKMIEKKTWEYFRNAGLLWFINSILHVFGWAIVVTIDNEKVNEVYPARVTFRGFESESNDEGYKKITEFLAENIDNIKEDFDD